MSLVIIWNVLKGGGALKVVAFQGFILQVLQNQFILKSLGLTRHRLLRATGCCSWGGWGWVRRGGRWPACCRQRCTTWSRSRARTGACGRTWGRLKRTGHCNRLSKFKKVGIGKWPTAIWLPIKQWGCISSNSWTISVNQRQVVSAIKQKYSYNRDPSACTWWQHGAGCILMPNKKNGPGNLSFTIDKCCNVMLCLLPN